jgi:hypothetical protein
VTPKTPTEILEGAVEARARALRVPTAEVYRRMAAHDPSCLDLTAVCDAYLLAERVRYRVEDGTGGPAFRELSEPRPRSQSEKSIMEMAETRAKDKRISLGEAIAEVCGAYPMLYRGHRASWRRS